jgi:predicted acyltransferase
MPFGYDLKPERHFGAHPPVTTFAMNRSLSLDALRGLAILLMVLSGVVPFRVLPDWMYHAQLPPPTHAFDATLAGLTWVDLVFPMFLFAMGAAIPLALTRRLESGVPWIRLHAGLLQRGFMLAFFAIFLQHLRPFTLNPDPGTTTWLTALAGFAALGLIYGTLPKGWSERSIASFRWPAILQWPVMRRGTSKDPASGATFHVSPVGFVRLVGWALAATLLASVVFPDGSGFRETRSDIIIIVLANMAVFGGLVWLYTRGRSHLRLGVMAVLAACILSAGVEGWVKSLWDSSPVPWVFRFYYLKYLFIVIPGMIAGEQLLRWNAALRAEADAGTSSQVVAAEGEAGRSSLSGFAEAGASPVRWSATADWSGARYVGVGLVSLVLVVLLVVGLHERWLLGTTLGSFAMLGVLAWLIRRGGPSAGPLQEVQHNQQEPAAAEGTSAGAPSAENSRTILAEILRWGMFWVVLGLCLEPFEGGIRKDWSTFSYYFVTSGVSVLLLVVFMLVLDKFGRIRWVPLLVENGQNPMLAYVGMMNLLYPVLGITGVHTLLVGLTGAPWMGFLRALGYTLLLAWLVALATRRRWLWKT